MAALTLHIQIAQDAEPRAIVIDPEDLTLGFLENLERAQESGKWRDMIPAIAEMFRLTVDESRAITLRQWRAMGAALKEAAESPNVSG